MSIACIFRAGMLCASIAIRRVKAISLLVSIIAWSPFVGAACSNVSVSCSTLTGAAVINEVNTDADFVEIYLLVESNISNWTLWSDDKKIATLGAGTCKANGTVTADNNPSTTWPAGTFIMCAYNMNPSNNEVLLADSTTTSRTTSTKVIDYLSYGTPSPNACWTVPPTCGTLYPGHASDNKDIARKPDGTGALGDNGDTPTPGTSNSGLIAQTITFGTVPTINVGGTGTVTATASSGLALTYGSTTASVCTVDATTRVVTGVAAGTCTITADQAGNSTYSAATQVTQSFVIAAGPNVYSAYETAITGNPAASATARYIKTRVASSIGTLCQQDGSTCSLKVAAFNSTPAILTTDNSTVSATLEYCSNVSRFGSTVSCDGTWVALVAAGTKSVALAGGEGTVTFDFVSNAYEMVRVKLAGTVTSYSNDYFAIRPNAMTIDVTDATVETAGTARSLTSGANTHKAGRPFTLTVTPTIKTSNGTATLYPGTGTGPTTKSVTTTTPVSGVDGTLTSGTWSASVGVLTSTTASYSEVGIFTLVLEDQNYADIDSADGQSGPADRYFSGTIASVGRFTPNHFTTAVTQGCNSGNFTYSGQPFLVTVTARESTGSITQNFAGAITLGYDSVSACTPTTTNFSNNTLAAGDFTSGAATTPAITNTAPSPLPIKYTQTLAAPSSGSLCALGGDDISSHGFTQGTLTARNGRLRLSNAFGSEKSDLAMTMQAQYWSGFSWVPNNDDSCSDATLSFAAVGTTDITSKTCVWDASSPGKSDKGCTAAATAAKQYKETGVAGFAGNFNLWLKAPGAGNFGAIDVTASVKEWLQFNWTGLLGNPTARATFGIYSPETRKSIHVREQF